MKIFQKDIFGSDCDINLKKEKKQAGLASSKNFPNITMSSALNELQAANDAMLIHRILQKRLLYGELRDARKKNAFMRILKNELSIKCGTMDSVTATRDSLIAFFEK
ncbi:MAG: hypothetical protein LBI95_01200 [Holosporales bacterium]|jgi:hypothetical protein|nr:hypothetical protein [Holosporales bacterium]